MTGNLTPAAIAALFQHASGPQPIRPGKVGPFERLRRSGLVYFDRSVRPRTSTLNRRGRAVLAAMVKQ